MRNLIPLVALIGCISCSDKLDKRLSQIEEDYSISLPNEFEVIQDDDISYNGFESDYEQIVKLKFDQPEFDSVKVQIEKTAFFNQLHHFENNSKIGSLPLDSVHQAIVDSLNIIGQKGTWIEKNSKYKFLFFGDRMDYVNGCLNFNEKTLLWNHHHL